MRAKFSVNRLRKNFRRGFSVVEVVVAMTVVVLLSAVGISACIVALKIQTNAINTELVYNVSEEFISAFYGAADSDNFDTEFKNRIEFALNCGDENLEIETPDDNGSIYYTYSSSGVTVTAVISQKDNQRGIVVVGHINSISSVVCEKSGSISIQDEIEGVQNETTP